MSRPRRQFHPDDAWPPVDEAMVPRASALARGAEALGWLVIGSATIAALVGIS